MKMDTPKETAACRRCGTCCRKGGPALHNEDKIIVDKGHIRLAQLYTIRKGELAHDNVKGLLVPVMQDIIKIKGRHGRFRCRFLAHDQNACRIYEHRPLECRLLACWDTRAIEDIYAVDRLSRADLLGGITDIWELVSTHEEKCSYENFGRHAERWRETKHGAALDAMVAALAYDWHLRQVVTEKTDRLAPMLDLLFGRPLTTTVKMFGIRASRENRQWRIVRIDMPEY